MRDLLCDGDRLAAVQLRDVVALGKDARDVETVVCCNHDVGRDQRTAARIAHVIAHSTTVGELVDLYRHYASFHTLYITFSLGRLAEMAKVQALLEVARELADDPSEE